MKKKSKKSLFLRFVGLLPNKVQCSILGHAEKKSYRRTKTLRYENGPYIKSRNKPFWVHSVRITCKRCGTFLRSYVIKD